MLQSTGEGSHAGVRVLSILFLETCLVLYRAETAAAAAAVVAVAVAEVEAEVGAEVVAGLRPRVRLVVQLLRQLHPPSPMAALYYRLRRLDSGSQQATIQQQTRPTAAADSPASCHGSSSLVAPF